jgi:hypothetical protein
LSGFACGEASLDEWLQRRARSNQASGASRTYVVAQGARVVGSYSLASGGIATSEAPARLRRNMPNPIPMTVIGRLADERMGRQKRSANASLADICEGQTS